MPTDWDMPTDWVAVKELKVSYYVGATFFFPLYIYMYPRSIYIYPRSPDTHIVGSWVIDSISLYRDPRTGTQYIGNYMFIYP